MKTIPHDELCGAAWYVSCEECRKKWFPEKVGVDADADLCEKVKTKEFFEDRDRNKGGQGDMATYFQMQPDGEIFQ